LHFCNYLPFEGVLEKIFFSIWTHASMFSPIVAPPEPWGPWCEQFWIYIISESFHLNMAYSDSVVQDIFKWPRPIFALL
jgi:hypothetical protein